MKTSRHNEFSLNNPARAEKNYKSGKYITSTRQMQNVIL